MRQVREVLRLKFVGGVPTREIARRIGVAASTVRTTIRRFQAAGLSWPLPEELTDAVLEARLFPDAGTKQGHRRQVEPDWASIHRELKRKHVTLSILWDEYIVRDPEGYRYSRFCELYRIWAGKLSVTMRQTHVGGDKLFVDYAGDTVPVIIDRLTGELRQAQIFVAVMGASSFTYVEATWTQTIGDWIGAHTRALAAIGGVPRLIVPDNAKVAVIKACLYEPQVNRTYAEMAAHYGTAVLPTRPRRPRDKAKVEACVLIVERWLIGRLRDRRFYGLAELNAAIGELLKRLNEERPIRRLGVTRRQLLEELDRPALKPLPTEPYVFAEWRVRRVGIDYHVDVEGHFYSVPYRCSRAARSRCGSPAAPWRSSSRASGSPCTCDRAATANTPLPPTTCHPVIAVTPTGPSAASAETPPSSARQPQRSAISSWSSDPIPSRASDPASASCGWRGRSASHVWKPLQRMPSRSARSPMARSAPSSTTSSIDTPHTSGLRTVRRSSIPTSAARATTNRRPSLAHPSHTRPASSARTCRHGQGLRRDRSIR
jgi:transposase